MPHLFGFPVNTVTSTPTCYNTCGFVQVSAAHHLGEAVAAGQSSNYKVLHASARWNLYFNNDLIGYYPDSYFSGAFTQAAYFNVYGEITYYKTTAYQCLQMGNGIAGNAPGAASFSNINVINAASSYYFYYYETLPFTLGNITSGSFSVGGAGPSC